MLQEQERLPSPPKDRKLCTAASINDFLANESGDDEVSNRIVTPVKRERGRPRM